MSYLLEHPLPIVFLGVFVCAMLIAASTQFRCRTFLIAALLVAMLTAGAVVIERITVTPAERIAATLQQIAQDLESNNMSSVLAHISSEATGLRKDAESILSQVEVRTVSIKRNLKVSVSGGSPRATAKFNAVATLKDRGGIWDQEVVPRFFEVELVLENGEWRVASYRDYDPRRGM